MGVAYVDLVATAWFYWSAWSVLLLAVSVWVNVWTVHCYWMCYQSFAREIDFPPANNYAWYCTSCCLTVVIISLKFCVYMWVIHRNDRLLHNRMVILFSGGHLELHRKWSPNRKISIFNGILMLKKPILEVLHSKLWLLVQKIWFPILVVAILDFMENDHQIVKLTFLMNFPSWKTLS